MTSDTIPYQSSSNSPIFFSGITVTPFSTHLTVLQCYDSRSPGLFTFNLDEELKGDLTNKIQWNFMYAPNENQFVGAAGDNLMASTEWNENYLVSNGFS